MFKPGEAAGIVIAPAHIGAVELGQAGEVAGFVIFIRHGKAVGICAAGQPVYFVVNIGGGTLAVLHGCQVVIQVVGEGNRCAVLVGYCGRFSRRGIGISCGVSITVRGGIELSVVIIGPLRGVKQRVCPGLEQAPAVINKGGLRPALVGQGGHLPDAVVIIGNGGGLRRSGSFPGCRNRHRPLW